jgi:hypothetical protein
MSRIEQTEQGMVKKPLDQHEDAGLGLDRNGLAKHCQELRSVGWTTLNELFTQNGRLANDFVRNKFASLPELLMRDVMILPEILEEDESRADEACSEDLNSEALDLLLNLMTISDLRDFIVSKGANVEFLTQLQEYVQECDLGNNTKTVNGQLTQLLNELKQ